MRPEFIDWLRRRMDEMDGKTVEPAPSARRPAPVPCVTCRKPLRRATSRHKCHHGVWCGIWGRPQLDYRSRTCEECNREIAQRGALTNRLA